MQIMGRKGKPTLAILILCLLILTFLSSGCSAPKEEVPAEETATEPEEEVYAEYCPLDGEGLDELPGVRPLAVMIDNSPQARPQSGLPEADVIYELPAEGGITRFMPIYYHGQAEVVGPVRSARPYFMDQALGWEAIFVHVGQSPQSVAYYAKNKVDHIDEFSRSKAFWRDKKRKMPHNLYTSTAKLREMAASLNFEREVDLPPFSFGKEPLLGKGEEALSLEILYPEKLNRAKFEYDTATGLYKRFTAGKEHLDLTTGDQLTAKNIIIQYVKSQVFDDEGRMEVGMLGEGKLLFFTDGRCVEGKWVKHELRQPTEFFDGEGNPLVLNQGQTWIQVASEYTKVQFN